MSIVEYEPRLVSDRKRSSSHRNIMFVDSPLNRTNHVGSSKRAVPSVWWSTCPSVIPPTLRRLELPSLLYRRRHHTRAHQPPDLAERPSQPCLLGQRRRDHGRNRHLVHGKEIRDPMRVLGSRDTLSNVRLVAFHRQPRHHPGSRPGRTTNHVLRRNHRPLLLPSNRRASGRLCRHWYQQRRLISAYRRRRDAGGGSHLRQ
ncbi:hypothetical protein F5Y17DRAFT_246474 [Xylariaceae sp. FL0594]|nr:hypothetical protein F5Y17DRAFT_246474 [Xylariaceae sp. FL0594]